MLSSEAEAETEVAEAAGRGWAPEARVAAYDCFPHGESMMGNPGWPAVLQLHPVGY